MKNFLDTKIQSHIDVNNSIILLKEESKKEDNKLIITLLNAIVPILFTIVVSYFESNKTTGRKLYKLSDEVSKIVKEPIDVILVEKGDSLNSYVSLFNSNKIFITSALMMLLSYEEALAVCLHEYSHLKNKDTIKEFLFKGTSNLSLIVIIHYLNKKLSSDFLKIITVLLPPYISNKLYKSIINHSETNADSYAVKMGYGYELKKALEKIKDKNLSKLQKNLELSLEEAETLFSKLEKEQGYNNLKDRLENIMNKTNIYTSLVKNPNILKTKWKEE